MAPRAYDHSSGDEAVAETRRRIVDATLALHAELGSTLQRLGGRARRRARSGRLSRQAVLGQSRGSLALRVG